MCPVDEFAALEPLCVIPPDICTGNLNPTDSNANLTKAKPADAPEVPLEAEVEPKLEPDREPDMFDNPEEYVGYDDEGLYMPIPPTQPPNSSQPNRNSPLLMVVNVNHKPSTYPTYILKSITKHRFRGLN